MKATLLVKAKNTVGESCFWDTRDNCLYWTDIEESKIYRLGKDETHTVFDLPERAGFVLPRASDGFVIGFASRVALTNANFSSFETLHVIEKDLPQTRINDATVDPYGGVVFGTFDEKNREAVGSVYRLAPDRQLSILIEGVTISNGLAFSPDGSLMYFADTPVETIRKFKVGDDFSSFEEIAPLAGGDIAPGKPDGAAVDTEGCYWSARVRGSCVARISPEGELLETIDVPTDAPTCIAFGGEDKQQIFITSLSGDDADEEAGNLFTARVDVSGVVERQSLL